MVSILTKIIELEHRIAEQERKNRNRRRTGVIAEVDHEKGLYRVQLGKDDKGQPYLTDWIRTRQLAAGGVKIDILLSVGEQVDVVSESGDLTDALIEMSTYSAQNPRENSTVPFQIKIGETVLSMSGGGVSIQASQGHLA